jgi:hypothetical protein
MNAGGYALATTARYGIVSVVKEADGTTYRANTGNPSNSHRSCTCPFFAQNAEFGACKHIYWAMSELEKIASLESLLKEVEARYAPTQPQEEPRVTPGYEAMSEYEYYNGRKKRG